MWVHLILTLLSVGFLSLHLNVSLFFGFPVFPKDVRTFVLNATTQEENWETKTKCCHPIKEEGLLSLILVKAADFKN